MFKKIISNKILKNLFFAGTLAILIIVIVLWWLKFYTNHGEKIETPNFIGLQINEAQQLAKEKDLVLVIDSVFSSSAPKGSILLQNPIGHSDSTNSWVKPQRKIYLSAVRKSVQMFPLPEIDASEMVVIPRLLGKFDIEKIYIEGSANAHVKKIEYNGKKVFKDDLLPRGAKIKVFIEKKTLSKPVSVPNLVGLTINEANLKLTDKGLGIITIYNNCVTQIDSTNGIISQQTPEFREGGGAKILEGEDIVVQINCTSESQ